MRREGRLRGKPTSKSRSQGCGGTRCPRWRLHPVEKSNHKTKGRYKRLAADMSINPRLAEFLFLPLKELQGFPDEFDVGDALVNDEDEGIIQLGILGVTVNSMIEAALGRIPARYGDNWAMDQGAATFNCESKTKGSVGSDESWSDVELLESDPESLVDDDWSLVDEEHV